MHSSILKLLSRVEDEMGHANREQEPSQCQGSAKSKRDELLTSLWRNCPKEKLMLVDVGLLSHVF